MSRGDLASRRISIVGIVAQKIQNRPRQPAGLIGPRCRLCGVERPVGKTEDDQFAIHADTGSAMI